jgi:hypothetical protein
MSLPNLSEVPNQGDLALSHDAPHRKEIAIDVDIDSNIKVTSVEGAHDVGTAGDVNTDTDTDTDTSTDMDSDSELDSGSHAASNDKSGTTINIPPDGERPGSWRMGLYSNLKQLVRDAKGAASKPVVRFI